MDSLIFEMIIGFLLIVVLAMILSIVKDDEPDVKYSVELKDGQKLYLFNITENESWVKGKNKNNKTVWINMSSVLIVSRVF